MAASLEHCLSIPLCHSGGRAWDIASKTATTPAMSNIVCFIVKSRGCPVPKGEQVFVFVEPSLPLRDVGSFRETTSVYSRQLRNRQRDSTQSTGPALRL